MSKAVLSSPSSRAIFIGAPLAALGQLAMTFIATVVILTIAAFDRVSGSGMASLLSSSSVIGSNSLGFQANMEGQLCKVWEGLHVSLRTAPSKRAPSKSSARTLHYSCALGS